MKGLLRASTVATMQAYARAARGQHVAVCDELTGLVGRLHPLEIAELCEAWREQRGIVRRPDVVDVREVVTA